MRDFVQVHALITCEDAPRLQHLATSARRQVLAHRQEGVVVVHTLHVLAHKDAVDVVDELALGGVDVAPLARTVGVQALVADKHVVPHHPAPPTALLVVPSRNPGVVIAERLLVLWLFHLGRPTSSRRSRGQEHRDEEEDERGGGGDSSSSSVVRPCSHFLLLLFHVLFTFFKKLKDNRKIKK